MILSLQSLMLSLSDFQSALVHSLWQGGVISALLFFLLRYLPTRRVNLRYGLSLAGLFAVVLAFLITWCLFDRIGNPAAASSPNLSTPSFAGPSDTVILSKESENEPRLEKHKDAISAPPPSLSVPLLWIWLGGVLVMMGRVGRLMAGTRNLRRQSRPPAANFPTAIAEETKAALGLLRQVTILTADGLTSPLAVGLFWPVVLLPAAMLTSLTPEQLRAVLAHEFAHIRRYDYLVNFMQLIIEALFYFNPAVWWLSRQIRIEREACCDRIAAQLVGDPVEYAAVLAGVARWMQSHSCKLSAAQALGGNDHGGLLERTRRLLSPGYRPALRLRWYSLAAGLLVTATLLLGLYQSSFLSVTSVERLIVGIVEELCPETIAGGVFGAWVKSMGKKSIEERIIEYGPMGRERLSPDFIRLGIAYPPSGVILLGVKQEKMLEVWVTADEKNYHLLRTYPIRKASGVAGPKLREGDKQVPEGLYRIESLNPNSRFHLSLRLNYPNTWDLARAADDGRKQLGGDIMIHGKASSIGCLAMGDDTAEDLFVLTADTGVEKVKVILAPVDFRAGKQPDMEGLPAWTGALYETIAAEMADLH